MARAVNRSHLAVAALSLSLVGLASIPLVLTTELDLGEYAAIQVELRRLSELHTQLDEHVLAIQVGILLNYDALVETGQQLENETLRVSDRLAHKKLTSRPVIAAALEAYRADALTQREIVETFKIQQAVLQNSRRFLPIAGRSALEAFVGSRDPAHFTRVLNVKARVFAHMLDGGDPFALQREIDEVAAELTHDHEAAAIQFFRHATVAILYRTLGQKSAGEIVNHPVHASLQRLNDAYDDARADIERDGAIARAVLFALSLGLIGFIGVVLLKLRARGAELAQINEGLEETIRERSAMLAQSQKLEAIGQLAAGIAHEINTPAQYVGDNLAFLQESFGELVAALAEPQAGAAVNEDLAFLLKEIPPALQQSREGIARVAEIVRAMKEFSHPGSDEPSPVDLNNAVKNTVTVTRNTWKDVAHLQLDLDPALPEVHCLVAQLNQAVLNLIVNAADAIREKPSGKGLGRIDVSTRRDGDHVLLVIRDDGPGIPPEIQHRVFDPFFTTKAVGKGTGQGLAITRSIIVDKHGGTIDLESQPGAGAVFRIRLPIEPPARNAQA